MFAVLNKVEKIGEREENEWWAVWPSRRSVFSHLFPFASVSRSLPFSPASRVATRVTLGSGAVAFVR